MLFTIPNKSVAQDEITDWPEGSAMHTGLLYKKTHDDSKKSLEKKHKQLIKIVTKNSPDDSRLINAIKAQHIAWLKYYATECEIIGALSGAGGSWPSTYAMGCQANLMDQRLRLVSSAINCINKIPSDKQQSEQNGCLYQLSPFTYDSEKINPSIN